MEKTSNKRLPPHRKGWKYPVAILLVNLKMRAEKEKKNQIFRDTKENFPHSQSPVLTQWWGQKRALPRPCFHPVPPHILCHSSTHRVQLGIGASLHSSSSLTALGIPVLQECTKILPPGPFLAKYQFFGVLAELISALARNYINSWNLR